MSHILGDRRVVLAREITKIHEEFLRGTAREILDQLKARPAIKGEMTLLVARAEKRAAEGDPVSEVLSLQSAGVDRMEAIKTVAKQFGLGKRELYDKLAIR
jgi:16S rRNA (cytidine1402-2'-O)-methyltransferase